MKDVAVQFAVYSKKDERGNPTSAFSWIGLNKLSEEVKRAVASINFQWKNGAKKRYDSLCLVRDMGNGFMLVIRCQDDGDDIDNRPHTLREECVLVPKSFYNENVKAIVASRFKVDSYESGCGHLVVDEMPDELTLPARSIRGMYEVYGSCSDMNIVISEERSVGPRSTPITGNGVEKSKKSGGMIACVLMIALMVSTIGNVIQYQLCSSVENTLQKKIQAVKDRKDILEGDVRRLENEIQALSSDNCALKEDSKKKEEQYKKDVLRLNQENSALRQAKRNLEFIKNEPEDSVKKLAAKLSKEVDGLKSDKKGCYLLIEDVKKTLEELVKKTGDFTKNFKGAE